MCKLKQQNPHISIIVSIGGGTGSKEFPALAANSSARQTFARQAREFCDRHGFDGIDRSCCLLPPSPISFTFVFESKYPGAVFRADLVLSS